jgi:hypothetical protein
VKEKLLNKTLKIKSMSVSFKLILNQYYKKIIKQDQEKRKQQEKDGLDLE